MTCQVCGTNKYKELITCQACGVTCCKGRRSCWTHHWCGVLTDMDGEVVSEGDIVYFPGTEHRYLLLETPMTMVNIGVSVAYPVGRRGPKTDTRVSIHTRLVRRENLKGYEA